MHQLHDFRDVLGRGAATSPHEIDEPRGRKLLELPGRVFGRLVVLAERVGQARIRVARDVHIRDLGQLRDVRPHVRRSQCAVDPDGQRASMRNRDPKGFDGLAGQGSAAAVGDRHREHQRQRLAGRRERVLDAHNAGLEVERVDDRLGEDHIGPPVDEATRLLDVGLPHLVEGRGPKSGVVHVGRQRQRLVGRPQRSRHESRPIGGLGGPSVRDFARDPSALAVDLVDVVFEQVVRLGDSRAAEGVGLDDVRARFEERVVDLGHRLGLGQTQDIVVALEVLGVIHEAVAAVVGLRELLLLQHRAHGAVEKHDPCLEE